MASDFFESVVEEATLSWLDILGYRILRGPEITAEENFSERDSYNEVYLAQRVRDALLYLNPVVPSDALDEAFRKITRHESPSLAANNRAFHRMLVEGVQVEYRRKDGSIAGDRVRLVDFEHPEDNDFLAVNQFTVIEGQHHRRPDIVVFVNGLPLAVIELKNPADD
jgi:type I restriction enzyme R subunit